MASYKDTSQYQSLTPDEKKLADLFNSVTSGTSSYTSDQLNQAIKEAKKDSAPYMQSILRVYQTQLSSSLANLTGNHQIELDTINENIKEINNDLARNQNYYTLQEQSDLQSEAQKYEQQKASIITSNASKGLTFSSLGEASKNVAANTEQNLVESTTRQYNKQMADLNASAKSQLFTQNENLNKENMNYKYNLQKTGLAGEAYLGTSNLPSDLSGYTPLGNVVGQYNNQVASDIESRTQANLAGLTQSSLKF